MSEEFDPSISTREFDARLEEVRRAVDLAQAQAGSKVDLREYVEALFQEKDRALSKADEEREKAAAALRDGTERAIREGDERLREHIANQIQQINVALHSANELELSRISAVQHELAAAQRSAAEAVAKAEAATEKRFQSVNEFRAQLATQTQGFIPREVAETQFGEIRKHLAANTDRINNSSGEQRGAADLRTSLIGLLIVLATLAAVVSPHIH